MSMSAAWAIIQIDRKVGAARPADHLEFRRRKLFNGIFEIRAGMPSTKQKTKLVSAEAKSAYFLTFKLDLIKTEMISRANSVYRPACGLDVRSLRVLRLICDAPGITATALREQTLIEKTLLSKLMADLIERKLVRRTIHPDDARHFQLRATAAGERMRAASDDLGQSLETEMLSMLSPDEREELNRIVDKLVVVFRRSAIGEHAEPSAGRPENLDNEA